MASPCGRNLKISNGKSLLVMNHIKGLQKRSTFVQVSAQSDNQGRNYSLFISNKKKLWSLIVQKYLEG
jgi:hypothetical protein